MNPVVPGDPMTLTKSQIDALVDGMVPSRCWPGAVKLDSREDGWIKDRDALKVEMYLSAGLTAEGERKPERVRLWRGKSSWTGRYIWFEQEPKPDEFLLTELTPGWFVPSEEGET